MYSLHYIIKQTNRKETKHTKHKRTLHVFKAETDNDCHFGLKLSLKQTYNKTYNRIEARRHEGKLELLSDWLVSGGRDWSERIDWTVMFGGVDGMRYARGRMYPKI